MRTRPSTIPFGDWERKYDLGEVAEEDRELRVPPVYQELWRPHRIKCAWGGRGSGKSHQFAEAMVGLSSHRRIRSLCAREYQTSIADSVHALLKTKIEKLRYGDYWKIGKNYLQSSVGSEIIFDGLHHNIDQIKSKEGIDVCWVEEAHSVTKESWRYLIPTIMRTDPPGGPFGAGSELWVTYNQRDETDETHRRFALRAARIPGAWVQPVTWEDNPYFPSSLDIERRDMLEDDPDAYEWTWGTATRHIGNQIIFSGKCVFESFETPELVDRFFYGADWGFSTDPSALVRAFHKDGDLWIDHEAFGYGVEIDDLPALFEGGVGSDGRVWRGVPGAKNWPIKGDAARPETISYMQRQGFLIQPAEKWEGCVEDGIEHLKGFRKIHIHERCKHMAREARLYSYKVDKLSGDVLPIVVDKHNHGWDAVRYSHDGYIQGRGVLSEWEKAFA